MVADFLEGALVMRVQTLKNRTVQLNKSVSMKLSQGHPQRFRRILMHKKARYSVICNCKKI